MRFQESLANHHKVNKILIDLCQSFLLKWKRGRLKWQSYFWLKTNMELEIFDLNDKVNLANILLPQQISCLRKLFLKYMKTTVLCAHVIFIHDYSKWITLFEVIHIHIPITEVNKKMWPYVFIMLLFGVKFDLTHTF